MNNEECIICNGNLDEKGADGIWDLAGVICDTVWVSSSNDEQGLVYDLIRGYLERLDYCPNCGKRLNNVLCKKCKGNNVSMSRFGIKCYDCGAEEGEV